MLSTQFRQSNTRKTSMPASAARPTKCLHHVVGIVGIADGVRRAEQHLQQQIGHRLAKCGEARPGILPQEAHGDVECRAAPALHRKQLRQQSGVVRRDQRHVVGAKPRRQQRLMRIAHARVGQQDARARAASSRRISPVRAHRASAWCRPAAAARRSAAAAEIPVAWGRARPLTSGLPLTITSPMKLSSRVARSRLRGLRNSSGV